MKLKSGGVDGALGVEVRKPNGLSGVEATPSGDGDFAGSSFGALEAVLSEGPRKLKPDDSVGFAGAAENGLVKLNRGVVSLPCGVEMVGFGAAKTLALSPEFDGFPNVEPPLKPLKGDDTAGVCVKFTPLAIGSDTAVRRPSVCGMNSDLPSSAEVVPRS